MLFRSTYNLGIFMIKNQYVQRKWKHNPVCVDISTFISNLKIADLSDFLAILDIFILCNQVHFTHFLPEVSINQVYIPHSHVYVSMA